MLLGVIWSFTFVKAEPGFLTEVVSKAVCDSVSTEPDFAS